MKKLILVLTTAVLFSVSGCNDNWLEMTNPNDQTTGSFWKTESDIQKGVNAAYMSMYYDGTYLRFAPLALDLRGDDVWSPSPWDVLSNTGSFKLFNNTIMQEWLWVAFYAGVYRSNQVLKYIDKVEFTSQAYKDRLKGEALFIRGLSYFHLVTFFENIPLVLGTFDKTEDYFPFQASPEDVWAQIYLDFDDASKLLPTSYSYPDVGRATKGAALGFLGKSYLFNKEYGMAKKAFEDLMGIGIYDLMANYAHNFDQEHENNVESIFEIQFSREAGGTNIDAAWVGTAPDRSYHTAKAITYAPTPFGWGDVAPTQWVYQQFLLEKTVDNEDDPRLKATMHYNYPGCTLYGRSFQEVYENDLGKLGVKKYCNDQSGRVDEKDWRSGINERLMRYADVLLMYAECLNELNDRTNAAKYVQRVRTRAKLADRENEFAALTIEGFRERLAHERLLEFVFEGQRFNDIRRWGWLNDPAKLAALKTRDSEFNSYVKGREFFSIPQRETDVNPNMKQNLGY